MCESWNNVRIEQRPFLTGLDVSIVRSKGQFFVRCCLCTRCTRDQCVATCALVHDRGAVPGYLRFLGGTRRYFHSLDLVKRIALHQCWQKTLVRHFNTCRCTGASNMHPVQQISDTVRAWNTCCLVDARSCCCPGKFCVGTDQVSTTVLGLDRHRRFQ